MKVLLVNGSPHEKGCAYTALAEIASTLNKEGIEPKVFHSGNCPGADEYNQGLLDEFMPRVRHL